MAKIIHDVKEGLYDARVVRALLKTASLFPIGSYVAISDGRVGRVIYANGDCYDRPTVELWRPGSMHRDPLIVDLASEPGLRIVRPLTRLD